MRHSRSGLSAIIFSILAGATALTQEEKEKKPDYFPLIADAEYTYAAEFKGRQSEYVIVVKSFTGKDVKGFYFDQKIEPARKKSIIGSTMFGLGAYVRDKGQLKTLEAFWSSELTTLQASGGQPLLDLPPRKGKETSLKANSGDQLFTLTVLGTEDVEVPAGKFKNCVKIRIDVHWPEKAKRYKGFVWLAPDVGVVRRHRRTGRTENLVSYTIPGR